jgi:hypothetical protein
MKKIAKTLANIFEEVQNGVKQQNLKYLVCAAAIATTPLLLASL